MKNKKAKNKKVYQLSEIVFQKSKDESLIEKNEKIKESIKEIGFKNTANVYSNSDSSKFGGNIGWIDEKNLSSQIAGMLKKIEIGSYTEPMAIGNAFLVLKIDDIKNEIVQIDEKKELEKMIQYEESSQLEKFSKIYYNKVKINTSISEL